MTEPVLVTGATGNVGQHVVRQLLDRGIRVRAASTDPAAARGALGGDVEHVRLDFTDAATWDAAYAGVRSAFLMRPPHLSRPRRQMLPSLSRARALGVRSVVLLSLQGAERNPFVPHAVLERWVRGSGLTWTFVRPSFFMQNLSKTHAADVRRGELVVPAGRGRTSFVDAADVAAVAVAALLDPVVHASRAWTPTGPQALSYGQVTAMLSAVLGRPVTYEAPGLLRYLRHARASGMPDGMVAVTAAIYTACRLGLAAATTDDVRVVVGRPPVPMRSFLERERAVWA